MIAVISKNPKQLVFGLLFTLTLLENAAMAIETPLYTVNSQEGVFEVRDYAAQIIAQTTVSGDRDEAANAGFRILAGYIFGGNTRKQSIAMTAPVVQARAPGESIAMTAPVVQAGDVNGWIIRFVMPRSSTLEALPVPNDPRVKLLTVPPQRYAVMQFSGLARPAEVEQRTTELAAFLARHGLQAIGAASLARYNPPWTLWFMRRNEVMVPLQTNVAVP